MNEVLLREHWPVRQVWLSIWHSGLLCLPPLAQSNQTRGCQKINLISSFSIHSETTIDWGHPDSGCCRRETPGVNKAGWICEASAKKENVGCQEGRICKNSDTMIFVDFAKAVRPSMSHRRNMSHSSNIYSKMCRLDHQRTHQTFYLLKINHPGYRPDQTRPDQTRPNQRKELSRR